MIYGKLDLSLLVLNLVASPTSDLLEPAIGHRPGCVTTRSIGGPSLRQVAPVNGVDVGRLAQAQCLSRPRT